MYLIVSSILPTVCKGSPWMICSRPLEKERRLAMNDNTAKVPIRDKYALDVLEAAEYFGIGERRLRKIITENLDSGIVLQNGVKYLIKRRKFEEYLDERTVI